MSAINTNGINVTYPVPGVNNNTQGFRDNFSSIKTNLDTAKTEITDIQNKAIVKSALTGFSVNNDMANTLLSNTLTRGFRASTYNLGNALVDTVVINVSAADVHYGTVNANSNVTLQFAGWAPAGTQSNVQLKLTVQDSNSYVIFPEQIDSSKVTLEYYDPTTTSVHSKASGELDYRFSTIDCGNTITVDPFNHNRQIQAVVGLPTEGGNFSVANGTITCSTASNVVTGSSTTFTSDLIPGRTIYNNSNVAIGIVNVIANNTSLTLTTNALVDVSGAVYRKSGAIGKSSDQKGFMSTDGTYLYIATGDYDGSTQIWKRITPSSY